MELRVSSHVSHQWLCTDDAPLPSSGSRWPRFPAFPGTIRALRLPALAWPSAHWFRQPAPRVPVEFVSAIGAPAAVQVRRRTGVWIVMLAIPFSSVLARGQEQDLPGSLAVHPVTLRRSTTPDDPLRLACSGASGAAPTRLTMKASSLHRFRGCTPLHHLLVYASRRALPHAMQDSLPAGGLRLCRAGVEPAGPRREVSAHHILLSRASPGAINGRRWSAEEKARVMCESLRPGERVGEVGRRYGTSLWKLSTWRGLARQGKLAVASSAEGVEPRPAAGICRARGGQRDGCESDGVGGDRGA